MTPPLAPGESATVPLGKPGLSAEASNSLETFVESHGADAEASAPATEAPVNRLAKAPAKVEPAKPETNGKAPKVEAEAEPEVEAVRADDFADPGNEATKAPEAPKVEAKAPEVPQTNKQLRTAYEATKAELEKARQEIAASKTAKPADDERMKPLLAEIETLKKEREEMAADLGRTAYEKSPQFKRDFMDPLDKQVFRTNRAISQFNVDRGDGNMVKADYKEDFAPLLDMPLPKALEKARELFGDAAQFVMSHWQGVKDLEDTAREALKGHRENSLRTESETLQQQEKFKQVFEGESQRLQEQYKDLFTAPDDDPKAKELLTKGYLLADTALTNPNKQDRETVLKAAAGVRHRAAAYGMALYQLNKEKAAHEATKAELAKVKGNRPGSGGEPHTNGKSPATLFSGLDSLARDVSEM